MDNSALTLTFTDDHGAAEASEFLSEYRDEIMRYLGDEVDVPLGPKITSELAADSVFVSSEHIESGNKITLAIQDPKIWLKIGIGIDEHNAILSSAIDNMSESIIDHLQQSPKEQLPPPGKKGTPHSMTCILSFKRTARRDDATRFLAPLIQPLYRIYTYSTMIRPCSKIV